MTGERPVVRFVFIVAVLFRSERHHVTSIEELRVAARGPGRKPLKPLWLLCFRCSRPFVAARIVQDCRDCAKANLDAYGTVHPMSEVSGF